MNLKISMGRRLKGHGEDAELNLTAVMNIFLILIPFLLLTAVFVKIAVLELSLLSLDTRGQKAQVQKPKSTVINILAISSTGFDLKSPEFKFSKINNIDMKYDWEALKNQLAQVKTKYPDSEDIIISPENVINYETIIQVMDQCRESGFPNISISG